MRVKVVNVSFWLDTSTIHCFPYLLSATGKEIESPMSLKDCPCTEDRITDSYRSENTSKGHLVQHPTQSTSSRFLKASLGSLLQCLTTYMASFIFLYRRILFHFLTCSNLCLLLLAFQSALLRSLALSSLLSPIGCFQIAVRSALASLLQVNKTHSFNISSRVGHVNQLPQCSLYPPADLTPEYVSLCEQNLICTIGPPYVQSSLFFIQVEKILSFHLHPGLFTRKISAHYSL